MADIKPIIRVELDPRNPVPEICTVIAAVLAYHPGREKEVLDKLQESISQHLITLKGTVKDEQIL